MGLAHVATVAQAKEGELMTKQLAVVAAAVLALAIHGSAQAQPVASITMPEPGGAVQLYSGCNPVALTFPEGTTSQAVVQAVSPAGVVQAMWSFNTALNRFEGFSPAAPQASDLLTADYLDAVWLCVAELPLPPLAPVIPPLPFEEEVVVAWELVDHTLLAVGSSLEESYNFVMLVENNSKDWGLCNLGFGVKLVGPYGDEYYGLPAFVEYVEPEASIISKPWALRPVDAWPVECVPFVAWNWCIPGVAELERSYHEFSGCNSTG